MHLRPLHLLTGLPLLPLTLLAQDSAAPPTATAAVQAAASPAAAQPAALTPDFQPLFAADDLSDGVIRGGTARYQREADGSIVGQPTELGGLNTFLCSQADFRNFVLRFSFRVDPALNAGVQIRSSVLSQEENRDVVGGPQVEIDTDPQRNRMWTGGLYGERVAPWLVPADTASEEEKEAFSTQGRELTRVGEWNDIVVLAVGPRLTTWFNGALRADLGQSPTETGFIGLQVHNVHDEGLLEKQIRWRGVEIWSLPDDAANYEEVRAVVETLATPEAAAAADPASASPDEAESPAEEESAR